MSFNTKLPSSTAWAEYVVKASSPLRHVLCESGKRVKKFDRHNTTSRSILEQARKCEKNRHAGGRSARGQTRRPEAKRGGVRTAEEARGQAKRREACPGGKGIVSMTRIKLFPLTQEVISLVDTDEVSVVIPVFPRRSSGPPNHPGFLETPYTHGSILVLCRSVTTYGTK